MTDYTPEDATREYAIRKFIESVKSKWGRYGTKSYPPFQEEGEQ